MQFPLTLDVQMRVRPIEPTSPLALLASQVIDLASSGPSSGHNCFLITQCALTHQIVALSPREFFKSLDKFPLQDPPPRQEACATRGGG